jgi:hypothetical protein
MTDLLERTHHEPLVPHRLPTVSGPPEGPPHVEVDVSTPWPSSAKIVSILLLVVSIVGVFGFLARDSANDRADTATEQVDQLREANFTLQSDLNAAESERDSLTADIAALTGRNVELRLAAVAAATDRDAAIVQRNVLAGELAAQIDRTTTATAERDAYAALFPMTFDASLEGADLVGTYDLTWEQIYCGSLPTCGTVPGVKTATITANDAGWLTITIGTFMTAGLTGSDGSLTTVIDNTTALPPVANAPRTARVSIDLYAHGMTVDADGTRHIDDLGASIVVSAAAVAGAPAGVVVYGLTLTPR